MIVGSPELKIGKILYGILQCTVHVQFYGTSKCIYPSRDADYCFYDIYFFVTIVSSLHCCPRSSAATRILRLSTTATPTLLATTLLGATVPYIFLFTSDKI
jgi:hypothetical protein